MEEPKNSADDQPRGQDLSHDRESGLAESAGITKALPTSRPPPHSSPDTRRRCRYFFGSGCKSGAACSFSHDAEANAIQRGSEPTPSHKQRSPSRPLSNAISKKSKSSHKMTQVVGTRESHEESNSTTTAPDPKANEKSVSKPLPDPQRIDPRQFQLNQLRRRFFLYEKEERGATVLTFKLVPTDPDFPFEMTELRCTLLVPHSYPTNGRPSLRVSNPEMDRGYQINVERGFDSLVTTMPKSTLLALINQLDRRLEGFLMSEKAQTIKLVSNTGKKPSAVASGSANVLAIPLVVPITAESPSHPPQMGHHPERISEAKVKRESDVRQLEARMGRHPLFSRSSDGLYFSVPLQISQSGKLPLSLQSVKSVELFVPLSYNLEPCSVSLVDVPSKEADALQAAFKHYATAHPEMTLMAHINYLAQNMHTMATELSARNSKIPSLPSSPSNDTVLQTLKETHTNVTEDRPHVRIIPRPPEWNVHVHENDRSDSYDTDESEDDSFDDETEDDDGGTAVPAEAQVAGDGGPDLGILLSFPSLELYGAELLQLFSVSLTVKCDRCKEMKDVKSIRSHTLGEPSLIKQESCNKCANHLVLGYRSEPMHSNSVRAGYLDLDGCTIVDLLPSNFIPTCSQCSVPYSTPGVVSFRGESTVAMCRECHQKMSFKIPDVKFLRVSAAGSGKARPLPKKRPKENLGITSGQELPRRGRCEHYAKSYRWFRFSCCSKVYPCDRCHDAAEEHPNEHANRMICGFCSREQIYRPEDCIHCHHSLVRKHGGGFWEGGKGTRDKVRMNRKDPRKYKRRPGGTVGGGAKDKTKK